MTEPDIKIRVNGDEPIPILMEYVVNVMLKEKNIPYEFVVEDIPIYDRILNPGKIIMVDYGLTFRRIKVDG